jgi:hypothetical protein
MSRIDGCTMGPPPAPGGTERMRPADELRRRFEDRLSDVRQREATTRDAAPPDARDEAARRPEGREEFGCAAREGASPRSAPARDAALDDARAADARADGDRDDGTAADASAAPSAAGASPAAPPAARAGADEVGRTAARVLAAAGRDAERASPVVIETPLPAPFHAAMALHAAAAAAPATDTAELVQWLMDRLPLSDPSDRTVTLTFPGASVPVERILLVREAGVLHLTVVPRADGHARVQDALKTLEDRLRSRGLRVGSLRFG